MTSTPGITSILEPRVPLSTPASRLFYERGWRGVHVEPVPDYAEQLRGARKDEMVVQAAVAATAGALAFFEIHGTDLVRLILALPISIGATASTLPKYWCPR